MRELRLSAFLLLLLLSSCATHAQFEKMTHSFVGATSKDLVAHFGPPSKITPLSSGEKVWSYQDNRTIYLNASTSSNSSSSLIIPIHKSCTYWFVLSPQERVESVGDKGNHCVAK